MTNAAKPAVTAEELRPEKIQVGISSCLLGQEVRFDGGHKRDSYITGTLSDYFDFVAFCPEAAVGLGLPRQPIRMVQHLLGYLKAHLDKSDREEMLETIEQYRQGLLPLIADYPYPSSFSAQPGPLCNAAILSDAPSEGAHAAQPDLIDLCRECKLPDCSALAMGGK